MMAKLTESYCKARQEDDQRKSIVQNVKQKGTDFLRRIIVPVEGQGGVMLSYVCPHCHRLPLEGYIWWVSMVHGDGSKNKKKQCDWWCAACGGQDNWRAPNRVLVMQDSAGQRGEGVSGARPAAGCVRESRACSQGVGEPATVCRKTAS